MQSVSENPLYVSEILSGNSPFFPWKTYDVADVDEPAKKIEVKITIDDRSRRCVRDLSGSNADDRVILLFALLLFWCWMMTDVARRGEDKKWIDRRCVG